MRTLLLPLVLLVLLGALNIDPSSGRAGDAPPSPAPAPAAGDASGEVPKPAVPEAPASKDEEAADADEGPPAWPSPLGDPRRAAVPLPAGEDWRAELAFDNQGVGVWTVRSFPVFDHLGCPELVALDDYGRLWVLVDYSGKWTSLPCVNDGWWLGGLAHADVDPRVEGAEIYTGSQQGRVWQVVAHRHGALESRLLARLPDREVQTVLAGEIDATHEGGEVLLFTNPGGLFLLTPDGAGGPWALAHLGDQRGHVRDAVVLPAVPGTSPEIATVSRDGTLRLLRLGGRSFEERVLYEDAMGLGRIALAPDRPAGRAVIYATHDDGRVLRFERAGDDWKRETIFLGPQGPRGIAAGPFGARPEDETVAVYGYSKKVHLLTRTDQGWRVEVIFEDLAAGHWLAACELDGRNATRELAACGFGGRVVLLSRRPGFGRSEAADPEAE